MKISGLLVGRKVHAPRFLDAPGKPFRRLAVRSTEVATRSPRPNLQAEFAIQPMNMLVINPPALAAQQYMDALVAVANADFCQFLDATLQSVLRRPLRFVKLDRPWLTKNQACPPLTDAVLPSQISHRFTMIRRLHHFIFGVSASIALKRLRSATIFSSFAFSSRSCCRSRA